MKPISRTAFYCCGVRMLDAESSRPICGDTYAKLFMNEEGRRILSAFVDEKGPNAANVFRHRIIDDILRQGLAGAPGLLVVTAGAGFDSRAFRLRGGKWVELDEPQLLAYKEDRLPVGGCPNALRRIPIDFSSESLEAKLAEFVGQKPVTIVVEGVLTYLEIHQIRALLQALRTVFPRHRLICDLMTRRFLEKRSRTLHEKVSSLGATFKFAIDRPEEIFERDGYRLANRVSIIEMAARAAGTIAQLAPEDLAGYSICELEIDADDSSLRTESTSEARSK